MVLLILSSLLLFCVSFKLLNYQINYFECGRENRFFCYRIFVILLSLFDGVFLFLWVLRKGGVSLCVFDGVFLFLWVLRKGGVSLCVFDGVFLFLWVLRKGGVSFCVFDGVFLFLWVLRKGGVSLCGTPWDLHITIMPKHEFTRPCITQFYSLAKQNL